MHWVVNDSRSYDLTLEIKIERPGAPPSDLLTRTAKYDLAQQCFNYSYTGEDTTRTALLAGMASGFGQ
jgi:histone-arginine methyltransferase CARM1